METKLQIYRLAEIDPETCVPTVVREGFRMTLDEARREALIATEKAGIKHLPCIVRGEHTFVQIIA